MDKDLQKNKRNTTMLGRKRQANHLFNNFLFRPMFQNDIHSLYETTSWQYKHLCAFNWDDKCIKDKEYPCKYSFFSLFLVDNMSPTAYWFFLNCSYFPSDLKEIKQNAHCLKDVFSSFSGEVDNLPLKKSSSIKQRILLEHDLLSLNTLYQLEDDNNKSTSNNSEASLLLLNLNELENKMFDSLKKVQEINERKTNELKKKLEQRSEIWYDKEDISSDDDKDDNSMVLQQKNNEEDYCNDNVEMDKSFKSNSNLLKDMMINQKEMNDYFGYLYRQKKKSINELKKVNRIFSIEEEINKIKEEDDWLCCVCNNGDLDENQLIYECISCQIAVHQSCYGIQTQCVQNWKCDPCKQMSREETIQLQCILCKVKGGAMKQVNLPLDSTFVRNIMKFRQESLTDSSNSDYSSSDDNSVMNKKLFPKYTSTFIIPRNDYSTIEKAWAHLSCCLWNPIVKFPNLETKTDISHIDLIEYKRWGEKCNLCNKRNYGPTLRCHHKTCSLKYHPECARVNHYNLEIENVDQFLNYNIYCLDHQPIKIKKNIIKRYEIKEKDILEFNQLLTKYYKSYEKEYKKSLLTIQPQRKLFYKFHEVNSLVSSINYSKEHLIRNRVNNFDDYSPTINNRQLTWRDRDIDSLNGNQKQFITKLTTLCKTYSSMNRIILTKKLTCHKPVINLSIEDDNNSNNIQIKEDYIYQIQPFTNRNLLDYNDLLNKDFIWNTLHFKNYDSSQLKKYFKRLVPDEESFNYYLKPQRKEDIDIKTIEILNENGEKTIRDFKEDIHLYCYCKKKCLPGELMLCCEKGLECKGSHEGWFHQNCIKETESMSEEQLDYFKFICNECKKSY